MKNSHISSEVALPLRELSSRYAALEQRAPDSSGIFWVTYLVGRGEQLGTLGEGSCAGYLVIRADGPFEAEMEAARLLEARSRQMGMGYTVTAVHSAAQLAFGLFALEAAQSGLIAATSSADFETWEEELGQRWAEFVSGH